MRLKTEDYCVDSNNDEVCGFEYDDNDHFYAFMLMMTLVLTMMIKTCVGYDDDNHWYLYSFYSLSYYVANVLFHLPTIL